MTQHDRVEAIRQTVAEYQRHQNDPDHFLPLHTPDTVVVNIVGRRVVGRDALAEAMRAALAGPLAKVTTTLEIEDIRFARPDVAIVSLVKHVSDQRGEATREQSDLPTVGSLTLVLVHDDGAWRIASAQTTPRHTF